MLILDEMADDYENLYQIKMGVLRAGMNCGLTIAPPEIASALADLLADGFVQAYRLYPSPVREIPNSIPVANLADEVLTVRTYSDQKSNDFYYFPTSKGREFHQNGEWPFDEEGQLLYPIEDHTGGIR
jgi:hypothetical protein